MKSKDSESGTRKNAMLLLLLVPLFAIGQWIGVRYFLRTVETVGVAPYGNGALTALARETRAYPYASQFKINFYDYDATQPTFVSKGYHGYLTYERSSQTLMYEETMIGDNRPNWREHRGNIALSEWRFVTNNMIDLVARNDRRMIAFGEWRALLMHYGAKQEKDRVVQPP